MALNLTLLHITQVDYNRFKRSMLRQEYFYRKEVDKDEIMDENEPHIRMIIWTISGV